MDLPINDDYIEDYGRFMLLYGVVRRHVEMGSRYSVPTRPTRYVSGIGYRYPTGKGNRTGSGNHIYCFAGYPIIS